MKSKNILLSLLIIILGLTLYKMFQLSEKVKVLESGMMVQTVNADSSNVSPKSAALQTTLINTNTEATPLYSQENQTIELFENAAPSVTFITTTALQRDYWSRNISEIPVGTGSGFIWDKEGHVVTNYHVIKGADKAIVTLADNNSYEATLVGIAPEKDLAVLKIDAVDVELIPIPVGNSYNLKVGQTAYAIGNPFGLDQTLTTGIISALGREIESQARIPIRDVIQTDAAINPGNSGGPLLDSSGKLIGVNTAIYSPSGAYAGIGFSIPVNVVNWVVPDLIQYGEVKRPLIGIEMVSTQIMNRMGLKGAMVLNIVPESPAEKAGLLATKRNQKGDIIVGLNGSEIKDNLDLVLGLEKYKPGERVTLQVLRKDKPMEIELQLDVQK